MLKVHNVHEVHGIHPEEVYVLENILLARLVKKKKKKGGGEVTGPEAKTDRFVIAKNAELEQWKTLKVYDVVPFTG